MFKKAILVISAVALSSTVLAAELADPTRPVNYKGPYLGPIGGAGVAAESLQLNSILYSETRQVAVINGQSLKVGDKIGGLTLEKVWADKVNLKGANQSVVLSLNPEKVKKLRR
ncbi:MAG: hypothetical protein CMF48_00495 [Legionellales bacterium]|nr:hypothetical protein [Legionellales bacterium]